MPKLQIPPPNLDTKFWLLKISIIQHLAVDMPNSSILLRATCPLTLLWSHKATKYQSFCIICRRPQVHFSAQRLATLT